MSQEPVIPAPIPDPNTPLAIPVPLNGKTAENLKTAFAAGGATIKDYFRFNNWERTINFFQVYDKKIDALGNPVIKMETDDGRTTHWAPLKQTAGLS